MSYSVPPEPQKPVPKEVFTNRPLNDWRNGLRNWMWDKYDLVAIFFAAVIAMIVAIGAVLVALQFWSCLVNYCKMVSF